MPTDLGNTDTLLDSFDGLDSTCEELKTNILVQEGSLQQVQENITLLEIQLKENITDDLRFQYAAAHLCTLGSEETITKKILEDKQRLEHMLAFKEIAGAIEEQNHSLGQEFYKETDELLKILSDQDSNLLQEEQSNSSSSASSSDNFDGLELACKKPQEKLDAQESFFHQSQENIASFETKLNIIEEAISQLQPIQGADNVCVSITQKLEQNRQKRKEQCDHLKIVTEKLAELITENRQQLEQMRAFKKAAEEIAQQDAALKQHFHQTSQELSFIKQLSATNSGNLSRKGTVVLSISSMGRESQTSSNAGQNTIIIDPQATMIESLAAKLPPMMAKLEAKLLWLDAETQAQTNRLSALMLKGMPTSNNAICLSIAQKLKAQINETTQTQQVSVLKSEKDRIKTDIRKITEENEANKANKKAQEEYKKAQEEQKIRHFVSKTISTFTTYLTERAATFKWRDKIGAALYAVANFFRGCFGLDPIETEKERRVFYIERLLIPALQHHLMAGLLNPHPGSTDYTKTILNSGINEYYHPRAKEGQPEYKKSLRFFAQKTLNEVRDMENSMLQNNQENSATAHASSVGNTR